MGVGVPHPFGQLGLDVSYRRVTEHLGEQAQRCGFATCAPGPFHQAIHMRTATLGLGWSVIFNAFGQMSTGVTVSLDWQGLEDHPGTGAGPGVYARLP